MSITISIIAYYMENDSPKKNMQLFLDNGWKPGYEDKVYFVKAKDDFKNDQYVKLNEFSMDEFINNHDENDPVRIDLRKGDFYGMFFFYDDQIRISIDDGVFLDADWPIPDFSWYLKELIFFFQYAGIRHYVCQVC